MNGENLTAKTPLGDFQVTTAETPLLLKKKEKGKILMEYLKELVVDIYYDSNIYY